MEPITPIITTLNIVILYLALAQAGAPAWSIPLDVLERQIAEAHRRDVITLDDDIDALLAVQLRTTWGR